MAGGDFGESRPRPAQRTVAMAPGVQGRVQVWMGRLRSKHGSLQDIHKRADSQLRHEPDQVGRQALVHGDGPNGRLIALQRGGQQRTGIDTRLINWVRICSAASPAPPRASASHSARSAGFKSGTGSGMGSPARAGTPRCSLAARYRGGSDRRGQPSALDDLDEIRRPGRAVRVEALLPAGAQAEE